MTVDIEKERTGARRAAAQWRLTFDAVESPILLTDEGLRVLRLNRAASDLCNRGFRECLDLELSELSPGEPWTTAMELASTARGQESRASADVCGTDGRSWSLTVSHATRDEVGPRFVVVMRETTAEAELQESLRKSEVMSALGSLVGGVAHEVRNPLFALSAGLDAFEARFGDSQEYERYLGHLREQLDRINNLMKDLLDYGKPVKPTLVPGPIDAVLAEAVRNIEGIHPSGEVQGAEKLGTAARVLMDYPRLLQAFDNLLENAIQHTAEGTAVRLTCEEVTYPSGPCIACTIADHGPGFDAQDLVKIFEPFYSRRRGGTGLGLSIVRRIIEAHGGSVVAGNREEGGGKVTVVLPLVSKEPKANGAPGELGGRGSD